MAMHLATADGMPAAAILMARQRIEAQLAPVPTDAAREEWSAAFDDRIRRLGLKAAPGMSVAQGDAWREVMVEALSDLPAMIALTAAKKAIHARFQFLNEVEGAVRDIAAGMIERRRLGLMRLDAMEAAIARAGEPKLPDPAHEPWTVARVHEANALFESSGLAMRYRLNGDQVESYSVRSDPHARAREAARELDQQREAA